jgi:hypothetical protein
MAHGQDRWGSSPSCLMSRVSPCSSASRPRPSMSSSGAARSSATGSIAGTGSRASKSTHSSTPLWSVEARTRGRKEEVEVEKQRRREGRSGEGEAPTDAAAEREVLNPLRQGRARTSSRAPSSSWSSSSRARWTVLPNARAHDTEQASTYLKNEAAMMDEDLEPQAREEGAASASRSPAVRSRRC